MTGAALLGRLTWQPANVVEVVTETPRVKTILFDVAGWPGHRAGQHVDIRLTAEDGYQAERSYSIAWAASPVARAGRTAGSRESGAAAVNPLAFYLHEIGRYRLLTRAEEVKGRSGSKVGTSRRRSG